jgi:hypothetical protein
MGEAAHVPTHLVRSLDWALPDTFTAMSRRAVEARASDFLDMVRKTSAVSKFKNASEVYHAP